MTIFAILATTASPALASAVTREFPNDSLEYAPGQFVVSADKLGSQDVARRLGVADGSLGEVVVFTTVGHWGFHENLLWEWLATRGTRS